MPAPNMDSFGAPSKARDLLAAYRQPAGSVSRFGETEREAGPGPSGARGAAAGGFTLDPDGYFDDYWGGGGYFDDFGTALAALGGGAGSGPGSPPLTELSAGWPEAARDTGVGRGPGGLGIGGGTDADAESGGVDVFSAEALYGSGAAPAGTSPSDAEEAPACGCSGPPVSGPPAPETRELSAPSAPGRSWTSPGSRAKTRRSGEAGPPTGGGLAITPFLVGPGDRPETWEDGGAAEDAPAVADVLGGGQTWPEPGSGRGEMDEHEVEWASLSWVGGAPEPEFWGPQSPGPAASLAELAVIPTTADELWPGSAPSEAPPEILDWSRIGPGGRARAPSPGAPGLSILGCLER